MIKGRVVSFDRIKGYGFVAPDGGGEDVFIHVNDLHSDKSLLATGSIVEFRIDDGERGPKAAEITLLQAAPGPSHTASPAAGLAAALPGGHGAQHGGGLGHGGGGGSGGGAEPVGAPSWGLHGPAEVYEREITEALLQVEPELTSRQILQIRRRMLRICRAEVPNGRG